MKIGKTVILSCFLSYTSLVIALSTASCSSSIITKTATVTLSQSFTTSTTIVVTATTKVTATTISPKALIPDTNLEAAITEELQLSGRPIYISDLRVLASLEASGRFISDLTGLEYCIKLQTLEISQNDISDLAPISGLPSLKILDLRNNNISDISPLVENSGIGQGDEINIKNNYLDLNEGSEDMENIKALEERGVTVYY